MDAIMLKWGVVFSCNATVKRGVSLCTCVFVYICYVISDDFRVDLPHFYCPFSRRNQQF